MLINRSSKLILALIYFSLTCLPVALKLYSIFPSSVTPLIIELLFILGVNYFLFLLLSYLKTGGFLLYAFYILISFPVTFFFVILGKNVDAKVISDLLESSSLIPDYLTTKFIILYLGYLAILLFFGYPVFYQDQSKRDFDIKAQRAAAGPTIVGTPLWPRLAGFLLCLIFFIANHHNAKKVFTVYPGFSALGSMISFYRHSDFLHKASQQDSASTAYNFTIAQTKTESEKYVVFLIGESTRSDYFSELSKSLKKEQNLILLENVAACGTVTRVAVPCLLTNVNFKKPEQFRSSVNIIEVFNQAQYQTFWLDNQSLHGVFDVNYSSLARKASVVLSRDELDNNNWFNHSYPYDENLLPYFSNAVNKGTTERKFIILHLMGSHWNLEKRYPEKFRIFKPTCSLDDNSSSCGGEKIRNSYKNSVLYTQFMITQAIDLLKDKNAILFFTSDHGASLGENGVFGNAADNNPSEQILTPGLIWYSEKFALAHPRLVKKLRANSARLKSSKLTHDLFFNSILGCSEIKLGGAITNPKADLCK